MSEVQCSGCSGCGAEKSGCHSCRGGCHKGELLLSAEEIELLYQFAETPFLPLVEEKSTKRLFLLNEEKHLRDCHELLFSLNSKELISIDTDIPIQGYDYSDFINAYEHGSAALGLQGQRIVKDMEIQGIQ